MDLRWPAEVIEQMEQRNDRGCLKKGKLDLGLLMLNSTYEDNEYRKIFEKQISGDKRFPPSLQNIAEAAPQRR